MNATEAPWEDLGIAPTPDQRAIRVAYTRKLKTIDVEADPAAFVALRDAFEHARMLGHWLAEEAEEADEAGDSSETEDAIALADAEPVHAAADATDGCYGTGAGDGQESAPSRPQPWAPIAPKDADAHAGALAKLVHGGEPGRYATPDENARMLAHWEAIAADPRMQQVDFYADAERWFAQLLAGTAPFTDVLIPPLVRHFGWTAADGTVNQAPLVQSITDRYRVLEFMHECAREGSQHHEAWVELTTPAGPGSMRGRISIKKVHRLIHQIRTWYPELEGCLDAYRVSMWKPQAPGVETEALRSFDVVRKPRTGLLGALENLGWPGWITVGFFALIIIGSISGHRRPAPASAPVAQYAKLADRDEDLNRVLRVIGDGSLRWDEVSKRNQKLAQLLDSNWRIARDKGADIYVFATRMTELLDERFRNSLAETSYDNIAAFRRIQLAQTKAMRTLGPQVCEDFLSGKDFPASRIPDKLRDEMRALKSRILLETMGDPRPSTGDGRFSIAGDIYLRISRRAGLGRTRLQAALNDKGTPTEHCNARIALAEIALELPPKQGLRLLREM